MKLLAAILALLLFSLTVLAQSPEIRCEVRPTELACTERGKTFSVDRWSGLHEDLIVVLYRDKKNRLRLSHTEEQERSQFGKNWREHDRGGMLVRMKRGVRRG